MTITALATQTQKKCKRIADSPDKMEMEITGLGTLTNTIKKVDSDFSILALKK